MPGREFARSCACTEAAHRWAEYMQARALHAGPAHIHSARPRCRGRRLARADSAAEEDRMTT